MIHLKLNLKNENSVIGKLVTVIGKFSYWNNFGYKSTFPTVYFIRSKYRSRFSSRKLASELRCAISENYTLYFKDLVQKMQNTFLIIFILITHWSVSI